MTIKELLHRHTPGTFRTRSPERDLETDLLLLKGATTFTAMPVFCLKIGSR